jgi:HlyD family secretion protein
MERSAQRTGRAAGGNKNRRKADVGWRIVGVTGIALFVMASAGCSNKEAEVQTVVTVQTAKVERMQLQQVVMAEAILFPKQEAAITPKVVAPVAKFYVNRGSRVHEGQLLAVLENKDIAASLTENKGALQQAKAAYETTTRSTLPGDVIKAEQDAKAAKEALDAQEQLYNSRKKLYDEGALPRKDLDQAAVALAQARAQNDVAQQHLAAMQAVGKQATQQSAVGQLASAQGKYEGAQAQLSYTEIRSPINGVVTDRPVWPGETAPVGAPLLTVMNLSSVVARPHIPQEQAALLKVGDSATITAANTPAVPAKVILVSPALDPNSTTVEVWVEAQNRGGALRPGGSVEVKIVANTVPDAVVVPAEALLKTPEGVSAVMVVGSDSRAHKTDVGIGIRSGNLVQITKGLQPGQTVVATGAYGLPDNIQVKVTHKPAAAAKEGIEAKD